MQKKEGGQIIAFPLFLAQKKPAAVSDSRTTSGN